MIKLIALITMLIDHIGLIFFPKITTYRIIGRISMPLFSYCLAKGYYYSKKKHSLKTYFKNLTIFSIISQLPYAFLKTGTLNIGFSWLFCLITLYLIKEKPLSTIILLPALIIIDVTLKINYGLYIIILTILMYYTFFEKKINPLIFPLMFFYLTLTYIVLKTGNIYQIFSIISLPIIYIINYFKLDNKIKLPKLFAYIFYPLHLAILILIKLLIT